jgi:uncharacterized cupredoxin-like copper-binding protein
MSFQIGHIATLAKYSGISFIAGAVNHGMFSEERSVLTAAVGVLFFILGGYLDMKVSPNGSKRWGDLLGFGILASIGLGFFTGGLQHFPDSPERSVWVVPLGFFLSLMATYFTEGRALIGFQPVVRYGAVAGFVVVASSLLASQYLQGHAGDGHDHAHAHGSAPASISTSPASAEPQTSARLVVVEMDDTMRFTPASWQAQAGESLRIVVINKGKVKHELVLGQAKELAAHALEMKKAKAGHHHHDNAVSVEPGQAAELLWTFAKAGEYGMACFEPGHYEAGMKGSVQVKPKPTS